MQETEIVTNYELGYMQERLQGLSRAIESLGEQKVHEDKFKTKEKKLKDKLAKQLASQKEIEEKLYKVCDDGKAKDQSIKDLKKHEKQMDNEKEHIMQQLRKKDIEVKREMD